MIKSELIKALEPYDDDTMIIISDGKGWCNIENLEIQDGCLAIIQELYPVFSDN